MVSAREQKHIESIRFDPKHIRRIKNLTTSIVDAALEADFHILKEKSIPPEMITRAAVVNGIKRIANTIDQNRNDSPGSMNGYNHFIGSELPIPAELIDDDLVVLAIECHTLDETTWDFPTRRAMLGENQLDKKTIREKVIDYRLSRYPHEARRLDSHVLDWMFEKVKLGEWHHLEDMLEYSPQYFAARMAGQRSSREDGTDYIWELFSQSAQGRAMQDKMLNLDGGLQIPKEVIQRMFEADGSDVLLEKLFRSGAAYGREGSHWRPRNRPATTGIINAMLDGLEALKRLGNGFNTPFQFNTSKDPIDITDIEFMESCPGFDRESRKRLHRIKPTFLTRSALPQLSKTEAFEALSEDPKLFCNPDQPECWLFDSKDYVSLPDHARKEICARNSNQTELTWPASMVCEELASDIVNFWAGSQLGDVAYLLTTTSPAFPPLTPGSARVLWEVAAKNNDRDGLPLAFNDIKYAPECFDLEFLKTLNHLPPITVVAPSVRQMIALEILAKPDVNAQKIGSYGWWSDSSVATAIVEKLAYDDQGLTDGQQWLLMRCFEHADDCPEAIARALGKLTDQDPQLKKASTSLEVASALRTLRKTRVTLEDYSDYIKLAGRAHFSRMECNPRLVPMLAAGLNDPDHRESFMAAAIEFCDQMPKAVLRLGLENDQGNMLDVAGACLEEVNTTSVVYQEREMIQGMYRARQLDLRSKTMQGAVPPKKSLGL